MTNDSSGFCPSDCLTTSEPRGYFFLFLKVPNFLLQGVTTLAKGRASAQNLKRDPLMEQYLATSAWLKERSRPILKWLVIAAAGAAIVALGSWFFSNRSKNAAELMARAMATHRAIVQNPLPNPAPGQVAYTTEDEKHRAAY